MKRRLLSFVLVIAMLLSMTPVAVFATEDTTIDTVAELQAAIVNGGTVTLGDNIVVNTETFTVADGKSVVLNMNGKKLTVTDNRVTGNYELFYIYGEMTVTGNGTIELTATTDRNWDAMSVIFHNRGGVLTINNGTFKNLGGTDMAFVVDNSGNYYGDATTNIIGGTLDSTYIAIRNRMEQNSHGASGTAYLNVFGGIISGNSRAIWAQAASKSPDHPATGEIKISGGNIGLIDTARSDGAVCETTISGGSVEKIKAEAGEVKITNGYVGSLEILTPAGEPTVDNTIITGGTFGSDVSDYVDPSVNFSASTGTIISKADADLYVSLGDSMSNGYGLDGYNGNTGVEDYGYESYANQFASYYGFNHAQLAMSAMRAEDLHWLLEVNYSDPAVVNVINTLQANGWNEDLWYSVFTNGDYWTWDQLVNNYRFDVAAYCIEGRDANDPVFNDGGDGYKKAYAEYDDIEALQIVAKYYQESVAAADVISLGIGNGNFGVFMFGQITDAIGFGGTPEDTTVYDIQNAIRECSPELQELLNILLEDAKAVLASKGIEADDGDPDTVSMMEALYNSFLYATISYALNYAGTVEAILQLNPDADIIQVALMNTMKSSTAASDDVTLGAVMDLLFKPLNAYLAALPTVMQTANNSVYDEASFFYAEAPFVECIVETYVYPLTDPIVRQRFYWSIVKDEDGDPGMVWQLLGGLVVDITLDEIDAYKLMNDAERLAYAAADTNKALSISMYLAFENAIIAGKDTSVDINSLLGVSNLFAENADPFGAIMEDFEEASKIQDDVHLDAICEFMAAQSGDKLTATQVKTILLGSDAEVNAVYYALVEATASLPAGSVANVIADNDAGKAVLYALVEAQAGLPAGSVANVIADNEEGKAVLYALVEAQAGLPAGSVANVIADNDAGKNVLYAIVANQMGVTPDEIANLVAVNNASAVAGVAAAKQTIVDGVAAAKQNIVDGVATAKQTIVDGVATAEATVASFNISAIAGPLYQLLVMPEVLGETVANSNLSGLLALFARCVIGNGIGSHPAEDGHNSMFAAMKNAYENEFTSQDQTINNLDYFYKQAYEYAKNSGAIDAAVVALVAAKGALNTTYNVVNGFAVEDEFANTKTLLLNELAAAEATASEIAGILAADQMNNLRSAYAALMGLEDDLWTHVSNIKALSAEIGFVADIYVALAIEAANHYSALLDAMANDAYAWVVNGVVEFNAEYMALVENTGALADQVDPALGAAVRKFMIEAPADTLAILYAYGEEAAINLFIAAADAADEIYVAATALASVMKDHGVDIYRAVMGDSDCQALRNELIALNTYLLALEAEAKNAPISTALELYSQIDALKAKAIELADKFYRAAVAAVAAADPSVAQALDDAFQALLKAVGTIGEAADGYAAWMPGHANAMAGEILSALIENWNEFTGVACPIVTEIVAQILTDLNEYVEGVIGEVENQVRYQLSVLDAELTKLKEQLLTAAGEAKEQILAQIAVLEAKINELHTILAEGIVKNFARAAQLLEEIKNDVIALANAAKDAALTEAYNALTAIFGNLAKLDELVKNAIGEKYEEFKAQVGAFATSILDRIFEAAARIAPELDAELYAFFYNNPDKVIAFFEEYGDEIAALGAEYGDEAIGTIGIALFLYGEDLAEYLIENREAVLEGIMNWADKYGERTVAMVQVYAEALGLCDAVRSEIAKLEDKIAALEAQLSYQIKVLDEQLNVELTKLNAQLAELYAQLENAVEEQKAIIEAKIAEVKALIAQVEAQIEQIKVLIAEIQQKLSEAQALLTEMYGKLQNLVDALYNLDDALKYLLNAGVEAATPVIQQALDAVADAVRELVGVVSAETAEQLDKIINEAKAFLDRAFYDATHANYHIDADSAYVALGDNKMVAQFFADYLKEYVAKEGVNYKYSTTDLTVENSVISDLSLIIAENMEVIASADLISLGYSYDAIAEETLTILIELLIEGTTDAVGEYDWVALVGDEAAAEIEAYLADLYDTMVAQGFGVTVSEMIGFPVESNVTIADAAAIAVEHFAYNAVEYAVLLPQTVLAIQAINPNALVMIHAVSNPLAGASVSLLGEEFIFGDYIDYIVDATNVESVIFAAVTDNVVFVPATKVVTNCTDSAIIRVNSLNDVIELMYAYKAGDLICIDPTDEGNAYVADKMAETLTITVEYVGGLLGDANNDGVVNSIDAAMILQYDVNMVDADMIYLAVCDVNGDGDVNSIDAAMILQFDVGSLEQFPAAVH